MKKKIITGTIWNTISSYSILVLQVVGMILLARVLTPEEFGIIAFIVSINGLSLILLGWGINGFLMRTDKRLQETFDTLTTLNIFGTIALYALMIAFYQVIFHSEGSQHLLLFIAIMAGFFLQRITLSHSSIVQKNMSFRKMALISLSGQIIGTVLALVVAYKSGSIWSLVLFTAIPPAVEGLSYLFLTKYQLKRLRVDKEILKEFFQYSKYNLGSIACDKLYRQSDDISVKIARGNSALGIYSQAYKLSELFSFLTLASIGTVSSSVFGKLKNKKKELSEFYNHVVSIVLRSTLFFYLPFLLLTEQAILFVYGDQWGGIVPLIHLLAPFAILTPYRRINRAVNLFTGRTKPVFTAHLYETISFIVVLIPGVYFFGLAGAAIAVNVGLAFGLAILTKKSSEIVELQLGKVFLKPFMAAAGTIVLFLLMQPFITLSSPFLYLAANSIIIVALYVGLLFFLEHKYLVSTIKKLLIWKQV